MTVCPRCGHDCSDRSTYTVRGAATALGVKVRRVQAMVQDGTLRALTEPGVGRATLIDGESVRSEMQRRSLASMTRDKAARVASEDDSVREARRRMGR